MTNERAFVTAHEARYAVSMLCRVLAISRGWFYGFLASQPARDQCHADRKVRDLGLLPKINTFFKASRKCDWRLNAMQIYPQRGFGEHRSRIPRKTRIAGHDRTSAVHPEIENSPPLQDGPHNQMANLHE